MQKAFSFEGNEYHLNIIVKNNSTETHYFVDVFLGDNRIKKAHFLKSNEDWEAVLNSSNHTIQSTTNDNELLYALKEQLINLIT